MIQYFKSKMPSTFKVQANEVVNQAKQEALARQQSRGIKTQETAQSLMTNPETVTQSPQAPQTPVSAQQPAQVAETPEQKTIEAVKYKEFLTNFQGYLQNNDVNSMIAVRNLAKQTFKNTNRLDAFKTQTDQLAKQKGIDISKF